MTETRYVIQWRVVGGDTWSDYATLNDGEKIKEMLNDAQRDKWNDWRKFRLIRRVTTDTPMDDSAPDEPTGEKSSA